MWEARKAGIGISEKVRLFCWSLTFLLYLVKPPCPSEEVNYYIGDIPLLGGVRGGFSVVENYPYSTGTTL